MDPTISIEHLTKRYRAGAAVDDLTFEVRPGRVTGFVGPNGAGKTTTMRMILGLTAPHTGRALIGGVPYGRLVFPIRDVGALLDGSATHPGRRARDHLRWIVESNAIPRSRIGEVLELVGLAQVADQRTGTYSLGMAQRLGLAAALLGDPSVLLLDEPVNGLDPDGIIWIRDLLRALAAEGRTVFVSSHLMSELQDTADHVVVIRDGRLLADAPVSELLASVPTDGVKVRTPDTGSAMTALANAGGRVASSGDDALTVTGLDVGRVSTVLASHGVRLLELTAHRPTLEEAYLTLTRGAIGTEQED